MRNLVARYSKYKGGVHGQSRKATRRDDKAELLQSIDEELQEYYDADELQPICYYCGCYIDYDGCRCEWLDEIGVIVR